MFITNKSWITLSVISVLIIGILFSSVGVLNSDFFGRYTEKEYFQAEGPYKSPKDSLANVTFIVHRILTDENAIEASIQLDWNRDQVLQSISDQKVEIQFDVSDGFIFDVFGSSKTLILSDTTKDVILNKYHKGFQSDRFIVPFAPSLSGFPLDDIEVMPVVNFMINGRSFLYNFYVQKRVNGRVLKHDSKNTNMIVLTRTWAEKCIVFLSSFLFLGITVLLAYSILTHKTGLTTLEEVVTVAGYILATAGFREIVGFSRNSGTSALEIYIILLPLLLVTASLIISFFRGRKK